MKTCSWSALLISVLTALSGNVIAQELTRPLTIVAPTAPGGLNDIIPRLLSVKLSESLRQNVVVENRPSANGVVAADYVARAAPDGSVVGVGNSGTHAVNATLYKKLPYDPVRDFAPITQFAENGLVIVSHPAVPANTVAELIALAKKRKGVLNAAIAGATGEVATNALKLQAGVDMTNVPYKGGPPAIIAIISGEVDLTITSYATVIQQVKAGKLKVLGVTSANRFPLLPNVPTVAESGLPGFEIIMWYGLFAPARTPENIVRRLRDEVVKGLNSPDIRQRLLAENCDIVGSTPEEFGAKVKRDVEKFRKVILESGMPRL
ncbi:MAG TPA: tripartite tricarboxylate transporter substrate binding protein [Burkholderiales bacterium]|nr:tripartite tricarboxylate transporter substrate binding protein [Burkholderiales bacterium]